MFCMFLSSPSSLTFSLPRPSSCRRRLAMYVSNMLSMLERVVVCSWRSFHLVSSILFCCSRNCTYIAKNPENCFRYLKKQLLEYAFVFMNVVSHNGRHLYLCDLTHFPMSELPHPFHTNKTNLWLQPSKISSFLKLNNKCNLAHSGVLTTCMHLYAHLALQTVFNSTISPVSKGKKEKATRCGRWPQTGWALFFSQVSFRRFCCTLKAFPHVCNVTKVWKVTTDTGRGI